MFMHRYADSAQSTLSHAQLPGKTRMGKVTKWWLREK